MGTVVLALILFFRSSDWPDHSFYFLILPKIINKGGDAERGRFKNRWEDREMRQEC